MDNQMKNGNKTEENKIGRKIRREIWEISKIKTSKNRIKTKAKASLPFMQQARSQKIIQGNMELFKMQEKVCIKYI
tara:strand:+ start:8989 stop:9216 length:228 start_codon:yes stop_codon:yes gene_type:complete